MKVFHAWSAPLQPCTGRRTAKDPPNTQNSHKRQSSQFAEGWVSVAAIDLRFFSYLQLSSPVLWKAEDSESGSKDDVRVGIYKGESEGIKPEQISKNTKKRGRDARVSPDSAALLGSFFNLLSRAQAADDEAQNTEVKVASLVSLWVCETPPT